MIRAINKLRLPLIILVVVLHANILHTTYITNVATFQSEPYWFLFIIQLFSENLSRIAVPTFFFISGYLFFYKLTDFNITLYFTKLRRRIRTLLCPYLLWNFLYIIWVECRKLSILSSIFPNADTSNHDFVYYLQCFWALDNDMPLLYSMWYVRNLIILAILSPILYFLIKRLGLIWIVLLAILYILDSLFDIPMPVGIKISSTFYFSIGALMSLSEYSISRFSKFSLYYAILFVLLGIVTTLTHGVLRNTIFPLMVFIGCLAFVLSAIKIPIKVPNILNSSVFFIFAFHIFILRDIQEILSIVIKADSYGDFTIVYFFCQS